MCIFLLYYNLKVPKLKLNEKFYFFIISATKTHVVGTLRQTLMQLESNIVLQFMHPNWSLLRKPWVQAVQLCQAPRDFSRALCVLQVSPSL